MKFSRIWFVLVSVLVACALPTVSLSAHANGPNCNPCVCEPVCEVMIPDAVKVEIDDRFNKSNELQSKILDYQTKKVDWWLSTTSIFLTLLGVAAAFLGYFGVNQGNKIKDSGKAYDIN